MNSVSPEVQVFFSLLVQAAIPALGTVLLAFATIAANSFVTWLKSHASQSQLAQVKTIIDLLVTSAQQSGLTGALSNEGSAKKQWVIDEVTKQLNNFGLTKFAEDVPLIEQLIETSVYELTQIKTPPVFELAKVEGIVAPLVPSDVG